MQLTKIITAFLFCTVLLCLYCTAQAQQWQPNKHYIKAKDTSKKAPDPKYQCWGTTSKGARCKRHVPQDHGFCYQHIEQAK